MDDFWADDAGTLGGPPREFGSAPPASAPEKPAKGSERPRGEPPTAATQETSAPAFSFDDEPTFVGAPQELVELARASRPPVARDALRGRDPGAPEPFFPPPVPDGVDAPFEARPPEPRVLSSPPLRPERPPLPLLVDVTPLSLSVETAGGFCDVIIVRNTPVPCEQSRAFVTARDGQEAVVLRVGQGEAVRFAENTLLGELDLSGLPPAPRGAVQIAVTFGLDTDGILNVRAADVRTGNATSATLRLLGLPGPQDVELMARRHAAHGEP